MSVSHVINSYDDFRALLGQEIVESEPIVITIDGIQDFCRGTHNEEWIHWDRARCQASPLGDIIAPGLYLPALYPGEFWKSMTINIPRMIVKGIDDIRIFKPVTAGSKITLRATVEQVLDRDRGIEVHYALAFVFSESGETVGRAKFINRYWGIDED